MHTLTRKQMHRQIHRQAATDTQREVMTRAHIQQQIDTDVHTLMCVK